MRIRTMLCWPLLTLVVAPGSARAQIGIEPLFTGVNQVNFYAACPRFSRSSLLTSTKGCRPSESGLGFEVLFRAARLRLERAPKPQPPESVSTRAGWCGPRKLIGRIIRECARAAIDTVHWKLDYKVERWQTASGDSVHVSEPREPPPTWLTADVTLALGYSQLAGLALRDASRFELHGAIRELPAISVYMEPRKCPGFWLCHIQGYLGFRTGLVQLRDVEAFDRNLRPDSAASVYVATAGQTFQIGGVLGIEAAVNRFTGFVELARMYRDIPSVIWTGPSTGVVPAGLPRSLDLSGWPIEFGVQVNIKP